MTEYVSKVKVVNASKEAVFAKLSDMSQLDAYGALLPADKVSDFRCDSDSCSCKVNYPGVNRLALRIVDREPGKTVKIQTEESPISMTGWLQIKEKDAESCFIRLTLHADIPFMLKAVVNKYLKDGIDQAADVLSNGTISY